ncbi:DUF3800 domain-containing protein [Limnohabitans sp. Hippo4]|uniref:DUF3800 domain-containing protein n=1 Tax=Limnohabitans sp. Hippo4 TaxID=1826167 RepID=UPI000D334485|nr:DUF3800 domain-containing protein [Limnohabitans sp. Hippo4]PUE35539.1 hypothetical protein B9Z46_10865 [Limnohabitans sp. Hippo4]
MQIIYFDEVKYDPPKQPYYWLGAIVVNAVNLQTVEKKVDELALKFFANRKLARENEFHAADIFHRKNHFKHEKNHNIRRAILEELANICSSDLLRRICVKIAPEKMLKHPSEIPSMAFMMLTEQVDSYLKSVDDIGMLIGDRENDYVSKEFAEALSHYRVHGTYYDYGVKVERLVDTVHFTESHLSRMLQLADAFIWLYQFAYQYKESKYTKNLYEHICNTQLRTLIRTKTFPTALSRIQIT